MSDSSHLRLQPDLYLSIQSILTRLARGRTPGDEEDIFALGYINSLHALELLRSLERRFEITVEDEDLDFDNFRTLLALVRFVSRKLAA